jgi:inhibitor of cysteine peptidase
MRAVVLPVAVLLAVSIASGCGEGARSVPGPVVRVIRGPDGTVRSLYDIAVTDGLAIELRGNAGTGYEWRAVAVPPMVAQRGEPTASCIGESIPGCAQLTVFEFDVVATGEGTLSFEYVRPWEPGVPPAQTFEVTLRVH